jgi:hypothetical protein
MRTLGRVVVVGMVMFAAGCSAAGSGEAVGQDEGHFDAPKAGPAGYSGPWSLTPDYRQCIPFDATINSPLSACTGDGAAHEHSPPEHPDLAKDGACKTRCASLGGTLTEIHFPRGPADCTLATAEQVFAFSGCEYQGFVPPEHGLTLGMDDGKPVFPDISSFDESTDMCLGHQGATGAHPSPGNLEWQLYDACIGYVAGQLEQKTTADQPAAALQDPNRWCSTTTNVCPIECGAVGQPTCVTTQTDSKGYCENGQEPEASATSPTGYVCPACGGKDEACCHAGTTCDTGLVCDLFGKCAPPAMDTPPVIEIDMTPCGGLGERCCNGTSCNPTLACSDGTCWDMVLSPGIMPAR